MLYQGKRDESERDANVGSSRLVFLCLLVVLFLSSTLFSQVAQDAAPEISADVASRLQNQIANGSVEVKRSALSDIRNRRSTAASRLAIPALSDSEPIVRATATGSVVFLPHNEAASVLIPLLNDQTEFVRREASYALGEVGDRSATGQLIGLMQNDKVLEVRTAATAALGKIGDARAIEGLLSILKTRPREDDEFLRRSAARSIGQIAQVSVTGNPTVLTPQNFLPEKFKDLGSSDATGAIAQIFSNAVRTLTDVLRDKNESDDTRREAAFSLGAIGDKSSIPVLQNFLTTSDPYLTEICKEALLKIERRNKVGPTD